MCLNVTIHTIDGTVFKIYNVVSIIDFRSNNQIEFFCQNPADDCGIAYDDVRAIVYDLVSDSSCSDGVKFDEVSSDLEYDF